MLKALCSMVFFGLAVIASAQSATDLSTKYPALTAYEVRPGVLMMLSYGPDAHICEMLIEGRHATNTTAKTTIDFNSFLPPTLVKDLVDELAPPSVRGKPLEAYGNWVGSATVDGQFTMTKYSYENVTVDIYGLLAGAEPSKAWHILAESTSIAENHGLGKSDDSLKADVVVIIRWTNRNCGEKAQRKDDVQGNSVGSVTSHDKFTKHR